MDARDFPIRIVDDVISHHGGAGRPVIRFHTQYDVAATSSTMSGLAHGVADVHPRARQAAVPALEAGPHDALRRVPIGCVVEVRHPLLLLPAPPYVRDGR